MSTEQPHLVGHPPAAPQMDPAQAVARDASRFAAAPALTVAAATQALAGTNAPSMPPSSAASAPSPASNAATLAESFFTAPAAHKREAIAGFFDRLLAAAASDGEASEILISLLSDDAPLAIACAATLDAKRFTAAMTEAGFADVASLLDVPALLAAFAAPIQAATGMALPDALNMLCGASDAAARKGLLSGFVPAAQWQAMAQTLRSNLESLDLTKFGGVKLLTDPKTGIAGNNAIEKFIRDNLPLYYGNLPIEAKIRIMRGQIGVPANATPEDRVLELLQTSGPSIKKLFQLYASQLGSKKLRKALEDLKERNRPFPFEVAKKIIEEELGAPISELFVSFSEETKAGTVAQVYKAVLKTPNGPRTVAVKVRRPDYLEQVEMELNILEKFAHDGFSRGIVAKLRKILADEGDFRVSAMRTRELGRAYKRARTIKLVPGIPDNSRVLVMDWVEAPSFSKLKKLPLSRAALVRQYKETAATYAEWLDRALTSDGNFYFHGDPHGGNLNYDDLTGTVGYFDCDNAARMTPVQQNAFVGIAVTMGLQMPEALAGHIITLSEVKNLPSEKRQALIRAIREELAASGALTEKLGAIFVRATNLGIELANGMPELQRAMMEFGAEMEEIKERIIEKGEPGFFERIMFKMNGQEALNAQAIFNKIKNNIGSGIEGISLELGRRYLGLIGR